MPTMPRMFQTRMWAAAAIIAVIVIIGFALSVPHTRDVAHAPAPEATTSAPAISVSDSYSHGTHTITGTITAPDACATPSADASLESGAPSTTPRILFAITLPPTVGVCLELPTKVDVSAKVTAPEQAPIDVMLNGEPVAASSS